MIFQVALFALAVSITLADPEAANTSAPALRGAESAVPAGDDTYIERDLIKDAGQTLADIKSADLETCALFCDALLSCNSFSYTAENGGNCHLKDKVARAADEGVEDDKGYHSYFKDNQEQEDQEQKKVAEGQEQENSTADEISPLKLYHDLDGISSAMGTNFIVCHGGRVCRGGFYHGRCRGGFVCRGGGGGGGWHGGGGSWHGGGWRRGGRGGGCHGVRVCRRGWHGGVCRGGFVCRRYR
eukprot:TRINITY_DN230_c0_g1_i8.p1 TRINITY_DN230_c0_g1~~TRINITY_DN230_c0_g1_i8.p1  ORF type:complete len:242 (-),score=62.22 TRINITY_DN230_c0_g1_i8:250-975(-)